jgi:hypothetical protein
MSRAPLGLMLLPKSRFSKRRIACTCCAARTAGVRYAWWAWREAACSMCVVRLRLRLTRCVVMAFSGAVRVRSWMMATFKRRSRPCRKRCGLLLCACVFAMGACHVVVGAVPHHHAGSSGFPATSMPTHARTRTRPVGCAPDVYAAVNAYMRRRRLQITPLGAKREEDESPTNADDGVPLLGPVAGELELAHVTCSSHSGVSPE